MVSFARWDCDAVHPDIVVALGQTAYHDEFFIDDAHSGYAAYDFACVFVLGAAYVLLGDVGHGDVGLLLLAQE